MAKWAEGDDDAARSSLRTLGAWLESALVRARNKWEYNHDCDVAEQAAVYVYGLSSNHGYRDGNKRIAFRSSR